RRAQVVGGGVLVAQLPVHLKVVPVGQRRGHGFRLVAGERPKREGRRAPTVWLGGDEVRMVASSVGGHGALPGYRSSAVSRGLRRPRRYVDRVDMSSRSTVSGTWCAVPVRMVPETGRVSTGEAAEVEHVIVQQSVFAGER